MSTTTTASQEFFATKTGGTTHIAGRQTVDRYGTRIVALCGATTHMWEAAEGVSCSRCKANTSAAGDSSSQPRITKMCAGLYMVYSGDLQICVCVYRDLRLTGPDKWVARAEWTNHTISDPQRTKAKAVQRALAMIETETDRCP